jgi:hypothetical protein
MLTGILVALFISLIILVLLIIFVGGNRPKSTLDFPCNSDSQCFDDLVCSNNVCKLPIHAKCLDTTECASGLVCYQEYCRPLSENSLGEIAPCEPPFFSQYNMCKSPEGSVCNGTGECIDGLRCENNICVKSNLAYSHKIKKSNKNKIKKTKVYPPPLKNYPLINEQSILSQMKKEPNIKNTLIVKNNNTFVDLLESYDYSPVSATMYGKYIVMNNENGDLKIFDTTINNMADIKINTTLHNLCLVNGYVTGIKNKQILQIKNEIVHPNGELEWTAYPTHIKADYVSASPDGNLMAVIYNSKYNIYDTSSEEINLIKTGNIKDNIKEIYVGLNANDIIFSNGKRLEYNNKTIDAHTGTFTIEGKFAITPRDEDYIEVAYLFNDTPYYIVDRKKFNLIKN